MPKYPIYSITVKYNETKIKCIISLDMKTMNKIVDVCYDGMLEKTLNISRNIFSIVSEELHYETGYIKVIPDLGFEIKQPEYTIYNADYIEKLIMKYDFKLQRLIKLNKILQ